MQSFNQLGITNSGQPLEPAVIPYDVQRGYVGLYSHDKYTVTYGTGPSHVIYQSCVIAEANGTGTPVAGMGGKGIASQSGGKAWGGTSVGVAGPGTANCTIVGLETGVINEGDDSNAVVGQAIVGDGTGKLAAALQVQVQPQARAFQDGILFNNAVSRAVQNSLIATNAGQAANGLDFRNMTFGLYDIITKNFAVEGGGTIHLKSAANIQGNEWIVKLPDGKLAAIPFRRIN